MSGKAHLICDFRMEQQIALWLPSFEFAVFAVIRKGIEIAYHSNHEEVSVSIIAYLCIGQEKRVRKCVTENETETL